MLDPRTPGVDPLCERRTFPRSQASGEWVCLASDRDSAALPLGQDTTISRAVLAAGASLRHRVHEGRGAYLLVVDGEVRIDAHLAKTHGRVIADQPGSIHLEASRAAEVLLIDVALMST